MRTVKLDVGDETVDVEVEVAEAAPSGRRAGPLTPASKRLEGEDADRASDRVSSQVLARAIRAVGSRLRSELAALSDPDELVLEFGASLKGGATVLLSAEGTFKVQLKWTKRSS